MGLYQGKLRHDHRDDGGPDETRDSPGVRHAFAAGLYQRGSASAGSTEFMVLEAILLLCGLVMTFKAYSRNGDR